MGVDLPCHLPLAGVALLTAVMFVPNHVNETPDPRDNLGGVRFVLLVGALQPAALIRVVRRGGRRLEARWP